MSTIINGTSSAITFPDSTVQNSAGLTAASPVISSGSLTFSNGSTQTIAAGIGSGGQTWQNLTSSRAISTTYTNSTGYPIQVSIWFDGTASGVGGNRAFNLLVNGSVIYFIGWYAPTGNNSIGGSIIVPNGATYSATASGAGVSETLSGWWELR